MKSHSESIEDLAEMFSAGGAISDRKAELYLASLQVIPADHLELLVQRIIDTRTSAFMPTVGEIKEEYTDLLLGRPMPDERLQWCLDTHKDQTRDAERAYFSQPVTTRGMFSYHPKPPKEFPDPVTAEAVRLCGWAELIDMDREYRAQFWAKKYATARELVAKRIQAGEVRLALPQPDELRPALKAVG